MDSFDNLFKNNKDSFDRLTPKEESWNTISKVIKVKNRKLKSTKFRSIYFLLKIAVVFVLIVGTYTFWNANVKVVDGRFQDIALATPEGNIISLDPSLNKYTLVQFWESGNLLCSENNCYYYLPAYEKYKEKGFEIYAISLDKDKEAWVEGIEDNDLPWIHVSDLQGWQSPICVECNISKLPTSFLLDNEGTIVSRDLDAALLDKMLGELLVQN